jgi:type IV secretory pathway VirB6-like protein
MAVQEILETMEVSEKLVIWEMTKTGYKKRENENNLYLVNSSYLSFWDVPALSITKYLYSKTFPNSILTK